MNASKSGENEPPERMLSAALHAQATGNAQPASPAAPAPPRPPKPRRLPVLRVLLFALLLGIAAGAVVGVLTLL
ncbi:uncharacterized protein involved in exopolysaccharide biosynthesis [Actinopolyspora biskrensis]|uniref:Uncharacterized protein involved in exopolysaccharide biosynthesis n=1 Tax=Actinopolyspora biskrensis TaxID=1470178 RepID=A0A852YXV3_9ACTN|nr:hypothetical protein [Actinopolyspora biskrensis]NYH78958.1 uncharacterized protein involved in exopolysaccharide biosynthesis [Actinopolyspora biskrensis]